MRLWHQALIPRLPRQQLLGQHRECCALRGNGWGKKHSTVDYVFKHHPEMLYAYHCVVMDEMHTRGYSLGASWFAPLYRGKNCRPWQVYDFNGFEYFRHCGNIYPEHDDDYLAECIDNLRGKGVILSA